MLLGWWLAHADHSGPHRPPKHPRAQPQPRTLPRPILPHSKKCHQSQTKSICHPTTHSEAQTRSSAALHPVPAPCLHARVPGEAVVTLSSAGMVQPRGPGCRFAPLLSLQSRQGVRVHTPSARPEMTDGSPTTRASPSRGLHHPAATRHLVSLPCTHPESPCRSATRKVQPCRPRRWAASPGTW